MSQFARRTAWCLGFGLWVVSGPYLIASGFLQAAACHYTCWIGYPSPWFYLLVVVGAIDLAMLCAFLSMRISKGE